MIGKPNSQIQPTALGTLLNASTYGMAIPSIYGMPKVSMLPIWAAAYREGGSGKKFKNKKKNIKTYVENIDLLIGHNPIVGVNQMWSNTTKLPLDYKSVSVPTPTFGTVPGSYTITDAQFYSVVAVTWVSTYSASFNDYGGFGPQSLSGTFEIPLWNEALNGPRPEDSNGYLVWPFSYYWIPGTNVVTFPVNGLGNYPNTVTNAKIYYTAKSSSLQHKTPLAYLRLTFEPILADGPEYTGGLSSQQVLMPPYAGCGSPNYDLGSSGAIPDTRAEVQGSYSIYPTGDADFADMITDVMESGFAQVSPADQSTAQYQQEVQHGASLFNYPVSVQKRYIGYTTSIGNPQSLSYKMSNRAGAVLLAWWAARSSGNPTGFLDDAGNTWNTLDVNVGGSVNWILAYAVNATATIPGNRVFPQVGGNYGNSNSFGIAELPLGFSFDTTVAGTVTGATMNSVRITTGNAQGRASMLFGFSFNFTLNPTNFDPNWSPFFGIPLANYGSFIGYGESRVVYSPGTYYMQDKNAAGSVRVVLSSFIQTGQSTIPKPLGSIIDRPSMEVCRTQARAYGFFGSYAITSQSSARDICKTLYQSMNSAPFYSGDKLKQAPYGEASAVGNGAIYTSPYASGPIAALSDLNGDFLGDAANPPVTLARTEQLEVPAIIKYQIPARNSDYNPVSVSQPDPGTLSLFGVRAFQTEIHDEIADPAVALALVGIQTRRQSLVRNMIDFKTGPRQLLLEPMDMVTITETNNALSSAPFRLTSVVISNTFQVSFKAEPYIYGTCSPLPATSPTTAPNTPDPTADPGLVNTPVFFEPVPRLYGSLSQAQLWAAISSSNTNYGGCIPYVSTDGGNSYNPVGNALLGSAITGVTTGDWPVASDPDTTNDLPLDLTESLGVLDSYLVADRDSFTYPCYIAYGSAGIPYGLLTYNDAVQTGTNLYTLKATGAGNELRRCVFGAPVAAPGPDIDHPSGSRFAFLGNPAQDGTGVGVMKVTMDPTWIGKTIFFKFLAFNTFGNIATDLSGCTAYSFTPTGIPGGGVAQNQSYSNTPALALSQTSTTNLAMVAVTTKFSSNTVNYVARPTITISAVGSPTWYYIAIIDPGYSGDVGGTATLSVDIQTTQVHLGVPGYTYIGAIQALPSGFASAIVLPGGYPPPGANVFG